LALWRVVVPRCVVFNKVNTEASCPEQISLSNIVGNIDNVSDHDPPVTAVASRRVRPGREQEFEEWVSGILGAAAEFPGYLGSNVIRPSDSDDDEFQIVFKFDRASNLKLWEGSRERREWLRKSRDLILEKEDVRVLTGLETWFTLPSRPGEPAPPRYKMAIVTWIAVFPLATAIFALTYPLLGELPTVIRTLVFTIIMVTLMTYVVMPRMTRLFSFWLYPKK
jgi:uncharacterized protein